jgi:hypothetical protein
MTMPDPFNDTPDPLAVAQWASVGRHALTYGGGFLSAFGLAMPSWLGSLSDPQINLIVSGVLFFGGLAMAGIGVVRGRIDKWRAQRKLVASVDQSAMRGEPVVVTVTPPGEDNTITRVSPAEIIAAPSVPSDARPLPAPPSLKGG